MSNSINPENQTLQLQMLDQNPNEHSQAPQHWETMARAWLSMLPEGNTVTSTEVEAWMSSNHASLPEELKSMPLPELYERFNSIQNSMGLSNEAKDANQFDPHHARFQRTDQWRPVYSWLETLDTDELIKSKDILDWLSENSDVKEQLYLRHSRYHLMHYIKKCHVKILKRKEKKKGLRSTKIANSLQVHKTEARKLPVPLPCNTLNNLPEDSDVYIAKRDEAFRKYEILLEFEKQLSTLFPKQENVNKES